MAYDYYSTGSDTCSTVAENRLSFARYKLLPRMLRDVSRADTSHEVFGAYLGTMGSNEILSYESTHGIQSGNFPAYPTLCPMDAAVRKMVYPLRAMRISSFCFHKLMAPCSFNTREHTAHNLVGLHLAFSSPFYLC